MLFPFYNFTQHKHLKKLTPLLIVISTLSIFSAEAKIRGRWVDYQEGNTVLEGYLAYDDSVKTMNAKGKEKAKPGILIIHDWMGPGPFVKDKAEALAKIGYIAFAADIYGKGVRPKNSEEAAHEAGKYKADRELMRRRAQAGLNYLREQVQSQSQTQTQSKLQKKIKIEKEKTALDTTPSISSDKIAAIGFCFGGTTVLELARSGADIKGVVSFHGNLDTPHIEDARKIKGKILVLHGANDPLVPQEQILAFQDEMRKAEVDWQMTSYGGAVHSFTNPAAGNDNSKGVAYEAKADRRSWRNMQDFFKELF